MEEDREKDNLVSFSEAVWTTNTKEDAGLGGVTPANPVPVHAGS